MSKIKRIACTAALLCTSAAALALGGKPPRAEVLHWWSAGGERAALKVIAAHYRAAGGVWVDTPVVGYDRVRDVAVNRIIRGNPPAAAQFNASKQFFDLIDEDMLSNVDAIARSEQWDTTLPEPVRRSIKVGGHYYAVPISLHIPTWFWYSKAAFKKAGVRAEPRNMDELFAALDKLKAAGIVPLAHGGEPWQTNIVFMAVVGNLGGKDLYLKVFRDRDLRTLRSPSFRRVLLAFKRLQGYVDKASPGRSWDASTAMLLKGRAGIQIMGDWVKGEILAAGLEPGKDIGCILGLNPDAPVAIQGDTFLFPKTDRQDVQQAQKLLVQVMLAPRTQLEFSRLKGSTPIGHRLDTSNLDTCTKTAVAVMKDKSRHVGISATYLPVGQNGAMDAIVETYWNTDMPVDEALNQLVAALKN